jgi:hypothetical protein
MPTLASIEQVLFWISTAVTALVVLRFFLNNLASRYPSFIVFLVLALARSLFVRFVSLDPNTYSLFYMATEAVFWVLFVLILLELYGMVLARYGGIQTFSKWMTMTCLGGSLVLAAISLYPDMSQEPTVRMDLLRTFFIAERGVFSALVLLIFLMSLFLLWYPIRLPKNVVFHSLIFTVYFLAKAFAILFRNLLGVPLTRPMSLSILAAGLMCLGLWLVLIRPAWERDEMVIGHRWDQDEEKRLIGQLRSINAALARIARE